MIQARILPLLILFVCSISPSFLFAQVDFSGLWKGIITQDEGGYKTEYGFELYLQQEGSRVVGRSYVVDGTLYAEMDLKGNIYNKNYLRFQELKIVDFTIVENMEWCIKKGHLILQFKGDKAYLTGVWKGITSFGDCIPGRIELERKIIRAAVEEDEARKF
ncbi:MAG: hypothetical protein AAF849_24980 [Bacteroidota bacterium]